MSCRRWRRRTPRPGPAPRRCWRSRPGPAAWARRSPPASRRAFGRGGQPAPGPTVSPEQAAAERQAKIDAANAERRRYLDAVERFRAGAEAFNAGCALRRYYESDMRAARARLGIAE